MGGEGCGVGGTGGAGVGGGVAIENPCTCVGAARPSAGATGGGVTRRCRHPAVHCDAILRVLG